MPKTIALILCILIAISLLGIDLYTYTHAITWEHKTAPMCFTDIEIYKGDVRIRYGTRYYETPGRIRSGTRKPIGLDNLITLQKTITVYRQTNTDPTPPGTAWHSSVSTLIFRMWLLASLFCIPPAVALSRNIIARYRRRKRNLCVACGYNLSGNVSGTCPECGYEV